MDEASTSPFRYADAEKQCIQFVNQFNSFTLVGKNLKNFDLDVLKEKMPKFHSVLMKKKIALVEARMATGITFSKETKKHRAEEDVDLMISTAKSFFKESQRREDKERLQEAEGEEEKKDEEEKEGLKKRKKKNFDSGFSYVEADHLKKAKKPINK